MNGCCSWFNEMLSNAGKKGHAIIGVHDMDGIGRMFFLQFRALDFEKTKMGGRILSHAGLPAGQESLAVAGRIPIKYCPSCGVRLDDLINNNIEQFDSLARVNQYLLK